LYQRLQQLANARSRSLSAPVIAMLSQAVEEEERRLLHSSALASIQRRRFKAPSGPPDSLTLLREDRDW
jgi:hypothetical protein